MGYLFIEPRGVAHDYTSLTPACAMQNPNQNVLPKPIKECFKANIITQAVQRTPLSKVLGLKENHDVHLTVDEKLDPTHGIDSHAYAVRNQPKDKLSQYKTEYNVKRSTKLMPLADSQYAALKNKIPQPK